MAGQSHSLAVDLPALAVRAPRKSRVARQGRPQQGLAATSIHRIIQATHPLRRPASEPAAKARCRNGPHRTVTDAVPSAMAKSALQITRHWRIPSAM